MQSLVGALHHRADLLSGSSANVGDGAARGHLRTGGHTSARYCALEPPTQLLQVALGRVCDKHRKLVTAASTRQIAGFELFGEGGGDPAQHPVAGGVIEPVIDLLEVVEIDRKQSEQVSVAAWPA